MSTPRASTSDPSRLDQSRSPVGFRRSRSDRWVAGVCGGLAARTGLDVTLVRVLAVLLALFGHLMGLIAYLACWALVPEGDAGTAPTPPTSPAPPTAPA